MTFSEKSNLIMLVIISFVFGGYFLSAYNNYMTGEASLEGLFVTFVGLTIAIVLYSVIGHIIVGIFSHKQLEQDGEGDERDRLIELKGNSFGGYALGFGVVTTMFLILFESIDRFIIAHALLASLVLAEILTSLLKLILYRRGA